MDFFSTHSNIAFMQIRWKTFALSIVAMVASLIGLATQGLTLSLDFTGGSQLELLLHDQTQASTFKSEIKRAFPTSNVQTMDRIEHVTVKIPESTRNVSSADQLKRFLSTHFHDVRIVQEVSVGPQVGKDLLLNGINALLFALCATLAYIALRFETRFAISAIAALMHDPIITLGVFSWAGIEFDLVSLAGVLTVLGYSLNDTVVVYDRIRENSEKSENASPESVVNAAINETLSRTVITSGLTLLAVLALFFFGGDTLYGFSLTLIIGIVVGTYSSIYVAGAIALSLGLEIKPKKTITPTLITGHSHA